MLLKCHYFLHWIKYRLTIVRMLDVQVAGLPATAQFRPRTAANIMRSFLRKSVTRRSTHAQKKREPGGCQFLLLVFCYTSVL